MVSDDRLYQRWIAADWSGAGKDTDSIPGLAVAGCFPTGAPELELPRPRNRQNLTQRLAEALRPGSVPTLVGLDFGFGYPSPAAPVVFGVNSWHGLPGRVADLMDAHHTARDLAAAINRRHKEAGPFRIEDRMNRKFYLRHGVPYYRLTEQFAPQAISQWYLGKGATVGFSTITGLACLGRLMSLRQQGEVDFAVFPFEKPANSRHAIAEIYPALYPSEDALDPKGHGHDALKSAKWLRDHCSRVGSLRLPSIRGWDDQEIEARAAEEGWILGIGIPT